MKHPVVFLTVFVPVLYLSTAAFAQHGGGFGRGFGGMSGGLGGGGRGAVGRDMGSSVGGASQGNPFKGSSNIGGKQTTSDLLTQNTKLSSKLQGLLPAGTNIQDAAQGFDHLGQFVAAVHVSHNLGIPFDQLKTQMTNGSSLGEAIHKLRPNVDARQQAIKANQEALDDMENSTASSKGR